MTTEWITVNVLPRDYVIDRTDTTIRYWLYYTEHSKQFETTLGPASRWRYPYSVGYDNGSRIAEVPEGLHTEREHYDISHANDSGTAFRYRVRENKTNIFVEKFLKQNLVLIVLSKK